MKTTKRLNGGRIKLTKNNINDGYIREFINKIEGSDKVLSDKELIEERNKILPSSIQNQNLYVFAYGSLLWNPTIDFEKQVLGKIYGFHRSFCMLTKLGRGSYENPGLMLVRHQLFVRCKKLKSQRNFVLNCSKFLCLIRNYFYSLFLLKELIK